jgi:hypothetical protein
MFSVRSVLSDKENNWDNPVRKYKMLNFGSDQAYDVQVIKLPLYHKIYRIGMICSAKPVLTEDLCLEQK